MTEENIAKALSEELEKDLGVPEGRLRVAPLRSSTSTVSRDIEALQNKLQNIVKGLQLLKDQL